MEQFFDKKIDLIFYNDSGMLMTMIKTPDSGPKPDIRIKGTLISESSAISTDITVVNLERDFEVDSVAWIYATLYYGHLNIVSKKKLLFYVQYADQSKSPPDRQVVFKCIQASVNPNIMSYRIKISHLNNKMAVGVPLQKLLTELISEINNSIEATTFNSVLALLRLAKEPKWEGTEYAKNELVYPGSQELTVYQWLTWLNTQLIGSEPTDVLVKKLRPYYKLHFFIRDDNTFVVQQSPSYDETNMRNGKSIVEITHVISAYRNGNIVHLKTLFDPRIHQAMYIHMSAFNIGGKRSLGGIVPLDKSMMIYFTPVGGINFEFGTVQGNSMEFQGVIEQE